MPSYFHDMNRFQGSLVRTLVASRPQSAPIAVRAARPSPSDVTIQMAILCQLPRKGSGPEGQVRLGGGARNVGKRGCRSTSTPKARSPDRKQNMIISDGIYSRVFLLGSLVLWENRRRIETPARADLSAPRGRLLSAMCRYLRR